MILSIIRHELRQLFYDRKTWYAIAAMQVILGLIYHWILTNYLKNLAATKTINYGITEEVLHPFYACCALLLLSMIPIITTNSISGEKQHGTMINYQCAPISAIQIILGKYYSINLMLLFALFGISCMPLWIIVSGKLDWGQLLAIVAGVYLLLSAALAIAIGVASFCTHTMRSNFLIFMVFAGLILLEWATQYTGKYALFLQNFGLLKPLKGFLAGILSVPGFAYYALIISCTLSLAAWRTGRRWYNA